MIAEHRDTHADARQVALGGNPACERFEVHPDFIAVGRSTLDEPAVSLVLLLQDRHTEVGQGLT